MEESKQELFDLMFTFKVVPTQTTTLLHQLSHFYYLSASPEVKRADGGALGARTSFHPPHPPFFTLGTGD